MEDAVYGQITSTLQSKGFDVSKLKKNCSVIEAFW